MHTGRAEGRISLQVTILASGSAGNCTVLETETTRVLVDAGLSRKEVHRRLAKLGKSLPGVDGILISHEHTDHIGGLGPLARQFRAPVYLTQPTHHEADRILPSARKLPRVEYIRAGDRLTIGDIEVTAFAVPHDAVEPVGFAFRAHGCRGAVVTDLGYLPAHVRQHLRDADCLVLESNHDLEMLKVGPYPWHVKQRVMSRTGHLSNDTVSEFLADAEGFDARPRYLVLGHLSETNNTPDVARICAEEALRRRPADAAFRGELLIADQRVPLGPFVL